MISIVVKRQQMHNACKVHAIGAYFIDKNVK